MTVKYHKARVQIAGALLVALSATLSGRADYQSTVLSQGPVGYWRLNGTVQPPTPPIYATNSGTLGAAGNGEYIQANRGITPGAIVSEPNSGAVQFLGSVDGNRVRVPYATQWNPTGPFSVELWAKPAQTAALQCPAASVFFTATPATQRDGWLIYQGNSTLANGNGFVFRQYNSTGLANQSGAAVNVAIDTTQWYHVVGVFDGTAVKIYVNGVLGQSTTLAGSPRANTNSAIPLTFGARAEGASGFFTYQGLVDESAFYSVALSPAQILAHYQAGTNAAPSTPYKQVILADNPVGYWRFNEPADPVSPNIGSLGSAGDAKLFAGTTAGVPGPRPSAYQGFEAGNNSVAFDGTSGSVAVPALNLAANTVTISGWLNATGAQALASGIILSRSGTTVAGLTIDAVYGGLGLGYNWANDPVAYNWSPNVDSGLPLLPDSDWAYVALVVQPTQAAIFICDRTNYANFAGVTNVAPHAIQKFEGVTLFGADSLNNSRYFKGAIDDVAIFNRALEVGELYSQYGAAVGGVPVRIFRDPQAPVDQLYTGDTLSLSVDAGGTPNLTYQWRKNTVNIAGATDKSYTKANVDPSVDSGTYDCVIANGFGTVISAGAVISILPALTPSITAPPVGHTLYPGGTLNLSVVAAGGGLRYQWLKGGTSIAGATNSTYSIYGVTTNETGSYTVNITNVVGSIVGGPVTITVLAPANAYETAIVADKPEAWFRLNETTGTDMFDSMGRHDGVYTNESGSPVTLGAAGAVVGSTDKAVTFDGASKSYGFVPYSARLNAQTFTIECWAKTDAGASDLVPVSSRSAVPQGYWLRTYPAGSWSGGVSQSGNSYYVPSATASDVIETGKWKHVVMVYDTSLKVYVNGQWDGQGYVNFERNVSAPLLIGALGGTSIGNLFKGQVDEVLVYTNGLTLAQVQNHYSKALFPTPIPPFWISVPSSHEVLSNSAATVTLTGAADGPIPITYQWYKDGTAIAGATNTALALSCAYSNAGSYVLKASNSTGSTNSPAASLAMLPPNPPFVNVTNGLVLHLKFDGDYSDSSGRGNNGTAVGAPTLVPGRLGSALFYSTSNSIPSVNYVTLGKPADLNLGASTDFSVAYWVKQDAGQTNGDLPFLCSAPGSYGNAGLTFAPSYKQGGWSYSLNGAVQVYGGPTSINDGNWHHLLHTFKRTGDAITYLDGIRVDTRPCAGAGNLDTGNTVNIGQDPTGAYAEDGSATLDDLAVWHRSLTEYEAYAIYYAATTSNTSFDVPGTVKLNVGTSGGKIVLSWAPGATLLQADDLSGPWTPAGAYAPYYEVTPSSAKKFYRLGFIE